MRHAGITLAALGILGLATGSALATDTAIPYPMTAQMAAKYGIQHPGLPAQVRITEAAHHSFPGRGFGYGSHGLPSHNYGHSYHGPAWGHGCRAPVIIYPPVYAPAYYYGYGPTGVFQYYGRGFSLGLGF